jgi:transcriptional regulator with XRE-family HTH domain
MTGAELAAALATLGWSQRHLAIKLGCNTNLPTWWARGQVAVPQDIGDWLYELAEFHARHPVPQTWRQRARAA